MTMKEGRTFPGLLRRYFPILTWGTEYSPRTLASDLVAAQGTPEHLGASLFSFDRARKKPTVTTM
jgi:hypothetical protein